MRLKCSWLLLKPQNEHGTIKDPCECLEVEVQMRACVISFELCVCVCGTSGLVCVKGWDLRFPSRPYWR